MLINVNTADKEELKQIPGVGERIARLLIQFREVYGVIKKEALNFALRGKLPAEALEMIDFSVPRQEDPFDIDLSCLPAVPKTNSWEPLVSFAHQTAARQPRYQVGESFAMSASHFAESHPLSWQVLQVCTSLRNPVLVELIQGQCLTVMRKMQSPL